MNTEEWESSFSVDGEGVRLGIKIHGYERRAATSLSDANWLRAKVCFDAEAGGCTVNTDCSIETHDLDRFCDQLQHMLDRGHGEAVFDTIEEVVQIRVELNDMGSAQITGVINGPSYEYVMNFNFKSDQTYAKITLNELKQAIRMFPVIKSL